MIVDLKTADVKQFKNNDLLIFRDGVFIPISFNELTREQNIKITILENKVIENSKNIEEQKALIKKYLKENEDKINKFINAFIFESKPKEVEIEDEANI
jgi:hypothetical protein